MFDLIPAWAKHYEEFWLTIRKRNLWFIKLRYTAVVMLLFFIIFPKYFLEITFSDKQQTALLIGLNQMPSSHEEELRIEVRQGGNQIFHSLPH